MRQLNTFITCVTLLLLLGCGGSGGTSANGDQLSPGQPADAAPLDGTARLVLEAIQDTPEAWSVILQAEAADLYQIAGSLEFDQTRYEILAVEAGGGLGDPQEAYFINSAGADGKLDFAYTSRFHGRLNSGNLKLLRIRVRTSGEFALSDFRLAQEPGQLRLRDSAKRELQPEIAGAGS